MTTQHAAEEPSPPGIEAHLLLRLRIYALARALDRATDSLNRGKVELDKVRTAFSRAQTAQQHAEDALAEASRLFVSLTIKPPSNMQPAEALLSGAEAGEPTIPDL